MITATACICQLPIFLIWCSLYFPNDIFNIYIVVNKGKIQSLESISPIYMFSPIKKFNLLRGFALNKFYVRIPRNVLIIWNAEKFRESTPSIFLRLIDIETLMTHNPFVFFEKHIIFSFFLI